MPDAEGPPWRDEASPPPEGDAPMKWKHFFKALALAAKIINRLDDDTDLLAEADHDNVVHQAVNAIYRDATRKRV